ncbi:MAG: class I SAM-dependent methyltransferase [Nostoc sp. ZfuVER08]|jgi:SAM-dependent methyltransferase|uniref:Class I SAM-dependent methyltransferase n=1 Tax=Nostoc punctiforme FACHB-252 TaxID=1357509 RepID=A0ABR8H6S0_NOSPU|nr:class I SAM-dependent methyltransferase [Nostoc punctiforme]MBD2610941.1 class I SAM-dependent methyltransferase [Nostoc punctiforme FACHB-252]MBL1200821.1 class I SAM-dependent methyltransferase [Nostoc sp. GBBB01]MDZ8010214.1 class I SAM-dependent methyltransferase [Nostoc sp. ZfuVER08]
MADDRSQLRTTFNQVALLYDRVRPGYPEALFDDVVSLSRINPEGRILEIGCGTGQATVPFARLGYPILCIELGKNLATVAQKNLAAYSQVEVRNTAFEDWVIEENAFDLVISATAFHWLDPTIAYKKTALALRSKGAIALFWNEHVYSDASNGFFEEVQKLYQSLAPELVKDDEPPLREKKVPNKTGEIEQTGLFGEVTYRSYRWDATYNTANYLGLLNTYSGHLNLDSLKKERFFDAIAQLIDTKFNGEITKGYLTTLYVAHRL